MLKIGDKVGLFNIKGETSDHGIVVGFGYAGRIKIRLLSGEEMTVRRSDVNKNKWKGGRNASG
tara:strand:- start:193 stop:381 length:189 start_codon:yes stop_codon:yes gene_type:complete